MPIYRINAASMQRRCVINEQPGPPRHAPRDEHRAVHAQAWLLMLARVQQWLARADACEQQRATQAPCPQP